MNYSNSNNDIDDFANLVSRSNPAASTSRGHAPRLSGGGGYPPQHTRGTSNGGIALDPFFDDDDEGPMSGGGIGGFNAGFGQPTPHVGGGHVNIMDNLDSTADLPLTKAAAAPAGTSIHRGQEGTPQGWGFDEDVPPPSTTRSAPSPDKKPKKPRFQFQWPWGKQKTLAPERKIWLNDNVRNDTEGYCSNYVSTSKYNLVTFVPKFLAGMLHHPSLHCFPH